MFRVSATNIKKHIRTHKNCQVL